MKSINKIFLLPIVHKTFCTFIIYFLYESSRLRDLLSAVLLPVFIVRRILTRLCMFHNIKST